MPPSEPAMQHGCVASEFRVEAMIAAVIACAVFAVPAVGLVLPWIFA